MNLEELRSIEDLRKMLVARINEQLNQGQGIDFANYIVLVDLMKDIYCAFKGYKAWPDSDEFHDAMCGIADEFLKMAKEI